MFENRALLKSVAYFSALFLPTHQLKSIPTPNSYEIDLFLERTCIITAQVFIIDCLITLR